MSTISIETPIAVVGAGTMGAGIAQVAAAAGHPVILYDLNTKAVEQGLAGIRCGLERQVARGKMTEDSLAKLLARITASSSLQDLAPAGLIIEAIVENLEIKQKLFAELESLGNEQAILASNTSSISITSVAAKLARPERLVGMHFFNPAPILKLVEVISGVATSPQIAQQIYELAQRWGKSPVFAKSTPGFIVNRVARPFYAEGLRVLEEGGADAATIDALVRDAGGFRMGPFELMDLIGNDVNYSVTCSVFNAFYQDPRFKPSLAQLELVNAGFFGRKSGRGFYNYGDDEPVRPATACEHNRPNRIIVNADSGAYRQLRSLAAAKDITVENGAVETPCIDIDGTYLLQTDGRSATELAQTLGCNDVVVFDLALDYSTAKRVAVAKADQCSEAGLSKAIGFLQALGLSVSVLDDIPGLVVMRIVAMLINEAADAVNQGVANAADVDIAMRQGVNYPQGPMAWANSLGVQFVHTVVANLYSSYGEDRYRPSVLLRRKAIAGMQF